jgi:hypothetical protein
LGIVEQAGSEPGANRVQLQFRAIPVGGKKEPIKGAAPVGWLSLTVTEGRKAKVKGVIGGHAIEAELQRENPADFPLMSHGFRWISVEPCFR